MLAKAHNVTYFFASSLIISSNSLELHTSIFTLSSLTTIWNITLYIAKTVQPLVQQPGHG